MTADHTSGLFCHPFSKTNNFFGILFLTSQTMSLSIFAIQMHHTVVQYKNIM